MMKSLLKKRLPGILVAGLVMLAVGAAGVTPAATASDASVSALTAKQKKAKARALKACNKKRDGEAEAYCLQAGRQQEVRADLAGTGAAQGQDLEGQRHGPVRLQPESAQHQGERFHRVELGPCWWSRAA